MITLTPSDAIPNTYSLNWSNQQSHLLDGLRDFIDHNDNLLSDVTLACDGEYIQAHKLVLSLCSSFFKDLFQKNRADKSNTIIILGNVNAQNLRYLMQFMYQGKVDIPSKDVDSFLQSGNVLKIEGLIGNFGNSSNVYSEPKSQSSTTVLATSQSQPAERTPVINATTRTLSVSTRFGGHVPTSSNCDSVVAPIKKPRLVEPVPSSSTSQNVQLTPVISSGPISLSSVGKQNQLTASLGLEENDPLDDSAQYNDNEELEEGEEGIDFNNLKSEPIEVYSVSYDAEEDQTDMLADEHDTEVFDDSLNTLLDTGGRESSSISVAGAVPGPSTSRSIRSLVPTGRPRGNIPGSDNGKRQYRCPKTKSGVWVYFSWMENLVAKCNICNKSLNRNNKSTTLLRRHLMLHHPEAFRTISTVKFKTQT